MSPFYNATSLELQLRLWFVAVGGGKALWAGAKYMGKLNLQWETVRNVWHREIWGKCVFLVHSLTQ